VKNLISDFKKRPFHLFIPAAFVLLCIAIFAGRQPFDINMLDTYFVMAIYTAFSVLIVLLILMWGLYKLTENILFLKWLTWFHVTVTITLLSSLVTINMVLNGYQSSTLIQKGVGLFVLTQIVFIVNIIVGMVRWISKKKQFKNS
jgi:hypothetical protein